MILLAGCEPATKAESPVECPDTGGYVEGAPAADVALVDCDGSAVTLRDLCGEPALVVAWYGWCPSCQGNAELAMSLAAEHQDLASVVALVEDPLGDPVDGALCEEYRETYPSSAKVWVDEAGVLAGWGEMDLVLVLEADGTIALARETSNEDVIREAIRSVE